MSKLPIADRLARLNEPQDFYRRMVARQKEDPLAERCQRIAQQIVERDRMIESLFASDKALADYVRAHPSRGLILKRMRRELKAKRGLVRRLARLQNDGGEGNGNGDRIGPSIRGTRPEESAEGQDLLSLDERLSRWRPERNDPGTLHSPASGSHKAKVAGRDGDSETISLYRALALQNLAEVHPVLPEIPENLSLCGFRTLFACDFFQKVMVALQEAAGEFDRPEEWPEALREQLDRLERLHRQWVEKQYELYVRWLAVTGRQLDFKSLPWLRDFGQWKAPVPSRLGWSNELYSLEARQMGHRPALADDTSAANPGDPPAGSQAADAEVAPPAETGDAGPADEGCEIERLYELSGGRLLRQPRQPGDEDKLYTFPGPLNRHENIFYDYSIIIPIDCTDLPCMDTTDDDPADRNADPARVLAGKARNTVDFLKAHNLAHVLGHYLTPEGDRQVWEDIEELLTEVEELGTSAAASPESVGEVRGLRKRLREMAGLMRLIARTEMWLLPLEGADLLTLATEVLKAADHADLAFEIQRRALPQKNESPHPDNRKQSDAMVFPDRDLRNANYWRKRFNETPGWFYPRKDPDDTLQWNHLTPYLKHLGGAFASKVAELRNAAKELATEIRDQNQNLGEYLDEFRRVAGGLVNAAVGALSYLLEEMANQIPLADHTVPEGRIRLALQVVFRQTWSPVAYVMGKLVGYKNLIPNQKETIHRRTFVKTVTETTTAEEFATARQDDYSHSQKETSEVVKEASRDFGFTQSVSGHFDVKIWGVEAETQINLGLEDKSRTVQNLVSESAAKGSAKFSEKREVKIRELAEAEDVQEVESVLQNLNQEITANYFYYQLLREYRVTVALEDLRPVLLRTRDVPSPTEIDDKFLSAYAHILLHHLPAQLATDAQDSADRLDTLARTLIRRRAEMDQRSADLELFPVGPDDPADTAAANRHREELLSKERLLAEARQAFIAAEEEYTRIRAKMDRVLKHLRENICHYMQFIWHESPQVDQDMLLREEEFCWPTTKLPDVTRGLLRQGYYGNEEIFDYTGPSSELFEAVLLNLRPGDEILHGLLALVEGEPLETGSTEEQPLAHRYIYREEGVAPLHFSDNAKVEGHDPAEGVDYVANYSKGTITFIQPLDETEPPPTVSYVTFEKFKGTSLYQYLARYYATEDMYALIDALRSLAFPEDPAHPFIEDPASPEEYLTTRNVQIPQDALVVETLPGQVPLLEGFQMAHRMLNVQKACLENRHLATRIADRPWETAGEDTYTVERIEGTAKEPAE
jgi:hypothetical protein